MREEARQSTAPGRSPRHARRHGLSGILVPHNRAARYALWSVLGLLGLGGLAAVALYFAIASGYVTADVATPYLEKALEERLGGEFKVTIGETAVRTMADGATAVVVSDIKIDRPDGNVAITAPTAEVELEGSLLSLSPRARRIDLIGAQMTVRIAASGRITLDPPAAQTARPASGAPTPVAPSQGASPQPAQSAPADPAAQAPSAAPATTGQPSDLSDDPLVLAGLAQWMNELERSGLDGVALADIGLKDGTLIFENESLGRRIVFRDISLRLSRPSGGSAVFTLTSHGPQGVSTAEARITTLPGGDHGFELTAQNISTRDLVQAFTQDYRRFYMDPLLAARVSARLAPDGMLKAAQADIRLGPGAMGNGEEVEERLSIDSAQVTATLDPARRVIVLDPLQAIKGANKIALTGEINVPARRAEPYPFHIVQREVVLQGDEMPDPPLVIGRVDVTGDYVPTEMRLYVRQGQLISTAGGLSFTSIFDFGAQVPTLKFDGVGSPMPVATIKRFWPTNIAPPARQYAIENLSAGTVESTIIAVNLPFVLIGQKQVPLPEDGLHLVMQGSGITLRPVKGLPPIVNAKMSVLVTGRTVRLTMPEGTVQTPQNRKIAVSDGVMFIPDHFLREPSAQIRVKFDGPADAGIEVLGMEPLKGPTGTAFDPSTTKGRLSALLQVNITFRKVPQPGDFDYSLEASLTDFGVDKVFKTHRLDGADVKVLASPAGILLRGEGKIAGAPVAFEYEKKKDVADADLRLNATLDDAARTRLGVSVAGLTGPVGVKLVGVTNNRDTRATLELDLTGARLSDLIPGLTKPPGKPMKARFVADDKGKTIRLDDLVMEGSGTLMKGNLELADSGDIISASFPTFQINDGDRATLKAERAGDVLKIRITGEVMDARGIMKSLVDTSAPAKKGQKTLDVDVDAKIGALTGNNGEVLRQFDFQVSRRGVETRAFTLTARAGRDGTVAGEMRAYQGRQRALYVSTSDAGAVLRFLDIYPKVQGGEAWIVMDPPRSDAAVQEGVVHVRDFSIRGEPGLERLSAAAADPSGRTGGGGASFEKAQAQFARSPGKVSFKEGAIWGPAAGATFDGTLDFAADRMAMRGTFVPAYGLNNLFSKLPVIGMFLGGGPNEGLLGVTFEIVGPISTGPTLRINPMSAVAPGFLRKMFEFRGTAETPPGR